MKSCSATTTWVLGLDLESRAASNVAGQLARLATESLIVRNIHSPEVHQLRIQALRADAPWVPTLFEVGENRVRAWTGAALISRVTRLVGPFNSWRLVTGVGKQLDKSLVLEPISRRAIMRYGLSGVAAISALLKVGIAPSSEIDIIEFLDVALVDNAHAAGGGKLTAEKLKNKDKNKLEERAEKDKDFKRLKDYFSHEDGRDWKQYGREAYRIKRNGNKVRDAFWITMKNPKGDQWVHVMFGREDNGKENSAAPLWRGDGKKSRFSDLYYVQNGNIRNEDGRVDGASVSAQGIPDDLDQLICPVLAKGPCVVGTGVSAAACYIPLGGLLGCVGSATVTHVCGLVSDSAESACKTLDGS